MLYYILIYIILCLLIKIKRLYTQNKFNYSNYKNCLLALEQYDKDLVNYLKSKER